MPDPFDPLRNPLDPLHDAGPSNGRDLFRVMGRIASEAPFDAVIDAAANLLINAIRQECASWWKAEQRFDEVIGRTKSVLKNHYDSASGRKRGIFPFDQQVVVPLFRDPDAFKKT